MPKNSVEGKAYTAPTLKRYGDIAKLTATGTKGSLENGSPSNAKRV